MRKNKHLYFLHIPKTSGTKMQYELLGAAKRAFPVNGTESGSFNVAGNVYIPGDFEFVFDPEIANTHNVICGHFARNPIDAIEGLTTFSIIREPFSQFLSLAKYAAHQSEVEFTEEFLELFLLNDNDLGTNFEGMSGCDNPQSCFLYSKISSIERFSGIDEFGNSVFSEKKTIFIEKPKSYMDLEEKIDGIIIGVLEKRNLLVEKINPILERNFGMHIDINSKIVNNTPELKFKISNRHKNIINEKTEIDNELYRRVSECLK
jgi:hypothetical protein